MLIDDLKLPLLTRKYVDDITVSEILAHDEDGRMQSAFDEIEAWSATNYMNINCKKTKETILGPLSKQQPLPLLISDHNVEQVTSYMLSWTWVIC